MPLSTPQRPEPTLGNLGGGRAPVSSPLSAGRKQTWSSDVTPRSQSPGRPARGQCPCWPPLTLLWDSQLQPQCYYSGRAGWGRGGSVSLSTAARGCAVFTGGHPGPPSPATLPGLDQCLRSDHLSIGMYLHLAHRFLSNAACLPSQPSPPSGPVTGTVRGPELLSRRQRASGGLLLPQGSPAPSQAKCPGGPAGSQGQQ